MRVRGAPIQEKNPSKCGTPNVAGGKAIASSGISSHSITGRAPTMANAQVPGVGLKTPLQMKDRTSSSLSRAISARSCATDRGRISGRDGRKILLGSGRGAPWTLMPFLRSSWIRSARAGQKTARARGPDTIFGRGCTRHRRWVGEQIRSGFGEMHSGSQALRRALSIR